jgi:hypothetical protein
MQRARTSAWTIALAGLLAGGCAAPGAIGWDGAVLGGMDSRAVIELAAHNAKPHFQTAVIEPQEEIPPPALLPPIPDSLPKSSEQLPPPPEEFQQDIRPIGELSTDISVPAGLDLSGAPVELPPDHARAILAQQPAYVRGTALDPAAHAVLPYAPELEFCYQPLFFEEVNVERYGRSLGPLQPALSIVQFYGRIPALPYMMVARQARACSYHAHWTLPGYRAPFERPQPIVRADAGLAETAFVYGMILLVP